MLRVNHATLRVVLVDHVSLGELEVQVLSPAVILVEDLSVDVETCLVHVDKFLLLFELLFAHLFQLLFVWAFLPISIKHLHSFLSSEFI